MSLVASRYAGALFETGCPEAVLKDTAALFLENEPLFQAMTSPAVRLEEKQAVLHRLPFASCPAALMNFYNLLAKKGAFVLLPDILREYHLLVLKKANQTQCVMRCAQMPAEETVVKLAKALCKVHKRDGVEMQVVVDPSLLGGFILEIDGITYNKSVSGQLHRLARSLQER
jgi:F-type H+-transporting ATPase subunit delta